MVHINESKLNSIPITTEPTRVPLEAKVLVNELTQPSLERTLIVTIDVPVSSMDTHVKLKEPVAQMTDTVAHKSGFGNLIKKMKRLKEGDVLALSVAETSKTSLLNYISDTMLYCQLFIRQSYRFISHSFCESH